jgi:Flagellar P-ring protein
MTDSPSGTSTVKGTCVIRHASPAAAAAPFCPTRVLAITTLCLTLLIPCTAGCATGLGSLAASNLFAGKMPDLARKKKSKKKKKDDNHFGDRVDTPLLSQYISVQGNNHVVLRGVGLVTGLDGTGDDPPPSTFRTQLQHEMTRRGVKNPTQILASQDTALVIVTALLPPMVRKDQRFDVRVVLPPNSKASSLKGGWLLATNLHEEQVVEGRGPLKGHEYATAGGAILLALGANDDRTQKRDLLSRGSIPGGAVSKTDRDLSVVLRTERRGFRNSKRVSATIAKRFYHYNKFGQRTALAEAKTDAMIELKVHPSYRNNFPRYQRVIRSLAFHESEVAQRMRLESLAEELLKPETTHRAALQLEAIGDKGIPFLKRALTVDNPEVQFESAQALAYLDDASGVEILQKAAEHEPAFRVYALAALSVIDDADAVIALRGLMSHASLETRYGAFTSLKELNPRDPAIPSIGFEGGFTLYTVDSKGEPMVHVKRYRAPEVVLFGTNQLLQLPAVLNAGHNIRVIGQAGSHEVTVTRYRLNEEPETKTVTARVFDVIRAAGNFGATYPDVVQLLIEAEQQHNLGGQFGIDRLPQAGRTYQRSPELTGNADAGSTRRIGSAALVPNLFDRLDEDEVSANESAERTAEREIVAESVVEPVVEPIDQTLPEPSPSFGQPLDEPGAQSGHSTDLRDDEPTGSDDFELTEPGERTSHTDTNAGSEPTHDLSEQEEPAGDSQSPSRGQRIRDFFSRPFARRS